MLRFADGSKYEGEFCDNEIEGQGVYYWPDGKIYKGEWEMNKMNGEGELSWEDGRRYKGGYKEDKKNGIGVFIMAGWEEVLRALEGGEIARRWHLYFC